LGEEEFPLHQGGFWERKDPPFSMGDFENPPFPKGDSGNPDPPSTEGGCLPLKKPPLDGE